MSNTPEFTAPELIPASTAAETPQTPESPETLETQETAESFDALLKQYAQSHASISEDGRKQINATIAAITADSVLLDIGYKTEGILPLTAFAGKEIKLGDHVLASVKGRDEDGYYQLSLLKVAQPKDFTSLEEAFASKAIIAGTVTAAIKGGFSVDVGVRAFMPSSRSGTRDAAEAEKLVGQEIFVRITKFEKEDEENADVVVDRRSVMEEEERSSKDRRFSEINEGDTLSGTVRSLADYGAFIDIGGTDGLLHISDIAWNRIANPADILTVGQQLDIKVLKIDPATRKISLGLKQLLPHPWDAVPDKYHVGDRVRGTVTRDADFGAFVELEPGVEGLVHISEMSWAKKVRKPSDMLKTGDVVETIILSIDTTAHRIGLGLKQTLGDPWADIAQKFPVGSAVEAPVVSFTKFGAFVQLADGIEGMIHISEITAEKRLNHPTDVLRIGQIVKAQILDVDQAKRQLRLSIKQLIPSDLDEFLADHQQGDLVTGRIIEIANNKARVELGEGIFAPCTLPVAAVEEVPAPASAGAIDLSALGSLLKAKWQGAAPTTSTRPKAETPAPGQIRSFRLAKLDREAKLIELDLA